jgi:antitoxin HigA-1
MKNLYKKPIHAGVFLADELKFIGINANKLSKIIDVPFVRIYEILNGQRGISADTAVRLGVFFGTGYKIWMNIQQSYEIDSALEKMGDEFKKIKPYAASK